MRAMMLVIILVGVLLVPTTAHAAGPCDSPRLLNIKPRLGHETVTRRVKALIACAEDRWSVPGGVTKALSVADCESSFWPWATNGSNLGVYQVSAWSHRVSLYLERRWFPFHWKPSWGKARANVMLGIRWAHRSGWRAWSCA